MSPSIIPLGKVLILVGLALAGVGALVIWGPHIPLIGKLPGDIHIKRDNFQFYFPLTTCLALSAVFYLVSRWFTR